MNFCFIIILISAYVSFCESKWFDKKTTKKIVAEMTTPKPSQIEANAVNDLARQILIQFQQKGKECSEKPKVSTNQPVVTDFIEGGGFE